MKTFFQIYAASVPSVSHPNKASKSRAKSRSAGAESFDINLFAHFIFFKSYFIDSNAVADKATQLVPE